MIYRAVALLTILAACSDPGSRDETSDAEAATFKPTTLTVLASNEVGANGIVADERAAYFVTNATGTTSVIKKIDLQTLAVTTFVPNAFGAVRISADADNLYFATTENASSRVVAVSKATGAMRDVATGQDIPTVVVVDGDSLYWHAYTGSSTATRETIRTVLIDGTGLRDLATVQGQLFDIVTDSTRVYTLSADGVLAIDKVTGATSTLPAHVVGFAMTNLAAGPGGVYVSNRSDNSISRISTSDGTMTTLATNQATPGRLAVASDGTVYWAARGDMGTATTANGGVYSLHPADATPTTIAMNLDHAIEPFVLTHAVLWTVYGSSQTSLGSVMAAPR